MAIFSFSAAVLDPIGLHARPAGELVELVQSSGLIVRIGREGEELVSASSPLRIMALKAKTSQQLLIEIEAEDAKQANQLATQIQAVLGAVR